MNTHNCNLCNSKKSKRIKTGVFGSPSQNIFSCQACGHLFLAPLLTDEEEERFYINEYPAFLLERGDVKSISPVDHFQKNQAEAIRRLGYIKKLLSKNISVLEIGSASGFFLNTIKPFVGQVCGIEPNKNYVKFANSKGIETHSNLQKLQNRKFDLIVSYYVLEHVKDPVGFLRAQIQLLKTRNSRICFEVPNAQEALVKFYRSKAYDDFVWQRAHCSYFSVDSIKYIFDKIGLTGRFIPIQRYDFSNHLNWLIEGKPGGQGKYSQIFPESFVRSYQSQLKKHWLCDSIFAVVKTNIFNPRKAKTT